MQTILADPEHPEHEETRRGAGGPFDLVATDLAVRRALGAVPETVRLLLEAVGDGVALTPGGRLPRRVLHAVQEHRPDWSLSGRPAGLEEDLLPLMAVHDVLRQVGVLRVRHGRLVPTKAASDDVEVVRRLRSWFGPDERFAARLASVAVAVLLADGRLPGEELARRTLPLLGGRWAIAGRPVGAEDVQRELSGLRTVLAGLDQVDWGYREWGPGPGAWWLLPGAVGMATAWEGTAQPHYRRDR